MIYNNILEAVGNTPLIKLNHINDDNVLKDRTEEM